jgi:hypothetical protein
MAVGWRGVTSYAEQLGNFACVHLIIEIFPGAGRLDKGWATSQPLDDGEKSPAGK